MRILLLSATVLAATALPAHAATSPACAVALVADNVGTTAECTTTIPNSPYRADRWLMVTVVSGTVDASIACVGFGTRSARVHAQERRMLSMSANTSARCVAELVAVTSGPKAVGVSSFTLDPIDE